MSTMPKITRREALKAAGLWGGAALLSACGVQTTSAPASSTSAPAAPTTAPAVKTTKTLTFWYPRSHPDAAAEEAFWKDTVAKFETANPGIKVDWVPQSWADLPKQMVAAIESGNTPDLTMTGFKNVIQYAAEGEVLPIDDVVSNLGGAEALKPLEQFFVWDGQWWGLPNTEGTNVFYYRKDFLEEAGFSGAPSNWEELTEAAIAMTKGDRYGIDLYYSVSNWSAHLLVSFIKAADGGILGLDGKPMLTDPKTIEAVKYYVAFLKEHKAVPPSRVSDTDWGASTMPAYGAGKVAMFGYSGGTYSAIQKEFPDVWEQTGVGNFPIGPSGHTGHVAYVNPIWAFAKGKSPDETKKFLEFTQSDEVLVARAKLYNGPVGGARGYKLIEGVPELWQSPVLQAQIEALPYAADGFFPLGHPVAGKADGERYLPKMLQDIAVNNTPVEEALAASQKYVEQLLAEFESKS